MARLIDLILTCSGNTEAVSAVSQYMHAPQTDHLAAAYRILQHLKGPGREILYAPKSSSSQIDFYRSQLDHFT